MVIRRRASLSGGGYASIDFPTLAVECRARLLGQRGLEQLGQLRRGANAAWQMWNGMKMYDDFRLFAIPNCGKGQPMQTKRMSNGGPTMRSRARLTGR